MNSFDEIYFYQSNEEFVSMGKICDERVQDRQYIIEDSYICLDGNNSFLISTIPHLCESKDLLDCGENVFFVHPERSSPFQC